MKQIGKRNAKIKFFDIERPSASGNPRSVPGDTRTTSPSGLSTGVTLRHCTTRKPITDLPGVAPPICPYSPCRNQNA